MSSTQEKKFGNSDELRQWLIEQGVDEDHSNAAAPLLLTKFYDRPSTLLNVSNAALTRADLPDPIAVAISNKLQQQVKGSIDHRALFLALVRKYPRHTATEISAQIFRILENKYNARYQLIAIGHDPEAAYDLLTEALGFPQYTTLQALRDSGMSIDGPFCGEGAPTASLFLACDTATSAPLIVKYSGLGWENELAACQELKLATMTLDSPQAIAPITVRTVEIRRGTFGKLREEISVLVMPQFCSTLSIPLKWLTSDCIVNGCRRMISALNYIHSREFVHMDVKGTNIFLAMNGQWYLADFGSCVPVNTPVRTFTQLFLFERLPKGTLAEYRYDWNMLAVCITLQALVDLTEHRELREPDLVSLKQEAEKQAHVMDLEKIKGTIEKLPHEGLRALLRSMIAFSGPILQI